MMIRTPYALHPATSLRQRAWILAENPVPGGDGSSADEQGSFRVDDSSLRFNISVQNILYVQSEHIYCRIYFHNDQRILQRISLSGLMKKLPADKFLRVHRSYAINVDYVSGFNGSRVRLGEITIPIGRKRKEEVLERLRSLSG